MKLPIPWLKNYVKVKQTPEELAELLTMSGTSVESVDNTRDGAVLEIEVTPNRPDCLSVLGLAREVSALTGKKVKFPKIQKSRPSRLARVEEPVPVVRIEDPAGCPLYVARLIRNVTIREAPAREKNFLSLAGIRSINHAVDAANFVLFEMGQPLHAFDYDKISGGQLLVRRAKKGEKFLALDDKEYELDDQTLVIADTERPLAIAGVIGGKLTEVTPHTKNILLESAFFDPVAVRRASRLFKLFTESSYRFERGVDFEAVETASGRARDLILAWGGGQETAVLVQKGRSWKTNRAKILLSSERLSRHLGLQISRGRSRAILSHLGFKTVSKGDNILVTPPSSRRDVRQEADLFEEVLRIEGFDKVPSTISPTQHTPASVEDRKALAALELKKFAAALGFHEMISYGLLSGKSLESCAYPGLSRVQKITNPASQEQEYLRPTLLPGVLSTVLFNLHRKAASLKLFEVGNRYLDGREETVLALCLCGGFEENWRRKSEASFFDLKGAVEAALRRLKIDSYKWEEGNLWKCFSAGACLKVGGREAGCAGVLKKEILDAWDIPRDVFYGELALFPLFDAAFQEPPRRAKRAPKFPSVRRDIAFVVDETIPVKSLEASMKKAASPYLQEIQLFDEFTGRSIASGRRSLAFSLAYQKEDGTFTDEEISSLQERLAGALRDEFRVEFR